MKLRNRVIWALALCTTASIAMARADQPVKPHAPVVQMPQDGERIQVSTPLGGPAVTLPARGGIPTGSGSAPATTVASAAPMATVAPAPRVNLPAPKVALPSGTDAWVVPGPENGPVVAKP
jgi:hypothetical protein